MTIKNTLNKLYKDAWHSKYLCRMTILDHIRECLERDNYLKARGISKESKEYRLLDQEMMDLKIALDFYFKKEEKMYLERINKYVKNTKKDDYEK